MPTEIIYAISEFNSWCIIQANKTLLKQNKSAQAYALIKQVK